MATYAYYAFGGGRGHAMRGLAVLNRLRRAGARVVLLAPERHRQLANALSIDLESPPSEAPDRLQLGGWLVSTLDRRAADRVLIDVFPRGVLREVAKIALPPAWLIGRWVEPAYYLDPGVRGAIEGWYQGLIWTESPEPELRGLQVRQHDVAPVLISRPEDCASRQGARSLLEVDHDQFVVLFLASGDRQRQEETVLQLRDVAMRGQGVVLVISSVLRPHIDDDERLRVMELLPAMPMLRAADLVVCAGGYHSFHETAALGLPAVYLPQPRLYDDQARRVAGPERAIGPEELARAIAAGPATPCESGTWRDGAEEVARIVTAT